MGDPANLPKCGTDSRFWTALVLPRHLHLVQDLKRASWAGVTQGSIGRKGAAPAWP